MEKKTVKKEKDNERKINLKRCIVCGGDLKNGKTWHHVIPKTLNPVRNILIPIHFDCHQRINSLYVNSLAKPKFNQTNAIVGNARNLRAASKRFIKVVDNINEKMEQSFRELQFNAEMHYSKQKIGMKDHGGNVA